MYRLLVKHTLYLFEGMIHEYIVIYLLIKSIFEGSIHGYMILDTIINQNIDLSQRLLHLSYEIRRNKQECFSNLLRISIIRKTQVYG